MLKGTVGTRYAEALFKIAEREDLVDTIEQELKEVDTVIQSSQDLRKILYHPQISAEEKKGLLITLLEDKVSTVTMDFLKLLVEKQRDQYFSNIVRYYVELANNARKVNQAQISSVVELEAAEKKQLENLLSKITGKKIKTSYIVDPSLIGGVVVHIGDRVIDGSIRTRLDTLKKHLKQIS